MSLEHHARDSASHLLWITGLSLDISEDKLVHIVSKELLLVLIGLAGLIFRLGNFNERSLGWHCDWFGCGTFRWWRL